MASVGPIGRLRGHTDRSRRAHGQAARDPWVDHAGVLEQTTRMRGASGMACKGTRMTSRLGDANPFEVNSSRRGIWMTGRRGEGGFTGEKEGQWEEGGGEVNG